MRRGLVLVLSVMIWQSGVAQAQWLNLPTPGIPRTRDGKPNLKARAPRAWDGKPDLSGLWHPETTSRAELAKFLPEAVLQLQDNVSVPGMEIDTISRFGINVFFDVKPDEVPMRPEAVAIVARRGDAGPEVLPSEHCLPIGFPLSTMLSELHKIVQAPGVTIMLIELDNTYRKIYTDGRKLPVDPNPSWYGYSVGRWEGDTFVVETNGLNDKVWLDLSGHPRSEAMRVTERYRRRDFGHLDVEITFDDPKLYTKPFTVKVTHLLQADSDILEDVCAENEKDLAHSRAK